jgi:structural maintenance of chromosomes protein 6
MEKGPADFLNCISHSDNMSFSAAEIEVTIKNCGPEAFKPDSYGDSIIVVRRFTKEGSSSYKLKSGETNKVISTKREELLAMCEQMQLQVDNPMNVLTQGEYF